MDGRGFGSMLFTAGAGALATVAGLYFAKKFKNRMKKKPQMKLFNNNLLLSTRCTWLISEMGIEDDFEDSCESDMPLYPEDRHSDMLMLPDGNSAEEMASSNLQLMQFRSQTSLDDLSLTDPDSGLDYDRQSLSSLYSLQPALVVNNDFTMIEGAAICLYLADTYGQFLPDQQSKAEYYSWVMYSAATFDGIIKTLQQQLVDTPERRRNPALLEPALQGFASFARALSDTLETRPYLCGEEFTAADCVLGFTLWWAYTIEDGSLLEDYPVLMDYLDRLKSRPAFQATFGPEQEWDWSKYFKTYIRTLKPPT